MVLAWNLVRWRFRSVEKGRKILTLFAFGCPTHNTEQVLWFWFRITPRRIAYYPRGVIYPQFGNHCCNSSGRQCFMREKFLENEIIENISQKFRYQWKIGQPWYTLNWKVLALKQIQMISLMNLTVDMINEWLSYVEVMMI